MINNIIGSSNYNEKFSEVDILSHFYVEFLETYSIMHFYCNKL